MKKITQLLIIILILTTVNINAQQECAVICHNGTLVKVIGAPAIDGHLNHHLTDVLISTSCDYEIIGNECETLSNSKFSLEQNLVPVGVIYYVYDTMGRLRQVGVTDKNIMSYLPREETILIKLDGYQEFKRIMINN